MSQSSSLLSLMPCRLRRSCHCCVAFRVSSQFVNTSRQFSLVVAIVWMNGPVVVDRAADKRHQPRHLVTAVHAAYEQPVLATQRRRRSGLAVRDMDFSSKVERNPPAYDDRQPWLLWTLTLYAYFLPGENGSRAQANFCSDSCW